MKKLLIGLLALTSTFGLFACKKKTSTTKEKTTGHTTTKKPVETVETDNPSYVSNFEPQVSETLPRIDINVDDNSFDFYTSVTSVDSNKPYAACKVTVKDGDTTTIDSVKAQVKVRGNYTVEYAKKPLRIKFDKKQSMLGLHDGDAYKNWVLLAEYKDWSMLRNATAFYLAHLMDGNYVSDFRLVNVYLNNQYYGVYLLAEQQEVKAGRIDITEADEANPEDTNIGYYLEYDGYYYKEPENQQFTVKYPTMFDINNIPFNRYQTGYTIKNDVYSSTQTTFIKNYIQGVFDICYKAIVENKYYEFDSTYQTISESTTIKSQHEAISKVLDIDSLVNSYILADIACDVDIAWSSFLLDVNFGEGGDKKVRFESPWDFDSSFGNTLGCLDGKGVYAGTVTKNVKNEDSANPWYLLFYKADWFKNLIKDKFNALKNNGSFTKVTTYITTMTTTFEADFVANYAKWDNCGHPELYWIEFEKSDAGKCKTQKEASECLVKWLNNRLENLDKIYNETE